MEVDEKKKGLMRPAALVKEAGISRQMLQEYLMYGLIRESARTPAGHRLFDPSALTRIRMIRLLQKRGYTLRDIKEVFKSAFPG